MLSDFGCGESSSRERCERPIALALTSLQDRSARAGLLCHRSVRASLRGAGGYAVRLFSVLCAVPRQLCSRGPSCASGHACKRETSSSTIPGYVARLADCGSPLRPRFIAHFWPFRKIRYPEI